MQLKQITAVLSMALLCGCNQIRCQLRPEPNYTLPNGLQLVYSKEEKRYSIKRNWIFQNEYLWEDSRGCIQPMFISISKPTMFADSGSAKAYAHLYIIQEQPTVTDFK
jgi:hypothetical protein